MSVSLSARLRPSSASTFARAPRSSCWHPAVVERLSERYRQQSTATASPTPPCVMQSNGGVMTADSALERPVVHGRVRSRAGVMAAAYLAAQLGLGDVMSFRHGRTTAKAGLVRNGRPAVTKTTKFGARAGHARAAAATPFGPRSSIWSRLARAVAACRGRRRRSAACWSPSRGRRP